MPSLKDLLHVGLYPVAIVQDRYGGVYSGGEWLAIAESDATCHDSNRVTSVLEHGPHGEDGEAADFWAAPPEWIASGRTPTEAIANLRVKMPRG